MVALLLIALMDFLFERAYQDSLECCTQFNMHGTSGLVAMTSASHAEGRQFDPGLVYLACRAFQTSSHTTEAPRASAP